MARAKKSEKAIAAEALLKTASPAAAKWTAMAATLTVLRGLAAIAFAWVVAGVLSRLVIPGADLFPPAWIWAALVGLGLARAALFALAGRAGARASLAAQRDLFAKLMRKIEALGPQRLNGKSAGDLVTRLTDGVTALDPYWRRWTPVMALGAAQPLAVLIIVAPLDWISAAILVVSMPLLIFAMILAGLKAKSASERQWLALTKLGGELLDAIQGLPDIALFNAAKREAAAVRQVADAYRRATMQVLRMAFLNTLALEFVSTMAIAALAIFIGYRLMWGQLDFRTGLFVLIVAPEIYAPIRAMGAERHARMDAVAAAEGLAELLALPDPAPGTRRIEIKGAASIRFDRVSFAFADGVFALKDVSFDIRAGERVAIVGPSGAGKSTLIALLLGFLTPTSGEILVNGAPLRELDLASWRRYVAYLPQRPHVFDADIDDNVALGRPGDPSLADPVGAALAAAGLDTVIAALPQGRRSRLAENGKGLSGGEIQRLAIARAFFGGGALALVDEPTAHLDESTERALIDSLSAFSDGRTFLMVAHRRASLVLVDRVIALEAGRLVADDKTSVAAHAPVIVRAFETGDAS